ncbi:MAG TPA: condensation domain-containing protein, partial [Mucilaginibacter sp.]|nr:condensation domain-containing protein [Mucilaginibacter sp.]
MPDLVLSGDKVVDVEVAYWKEKLKDVVPLKLTADLPRPAMGNMGRAVIDFFINKELCEQLALFSTEQDVTLLITLLSAFYVLLNRYTNQADICIGNVVSEPGRDKTTGKFNTLALRSDIKGNDMFPDLLKQVNGIVKEAYSYQKIPFTKIINNLSKETGKDKNQFFGVIFALVDGGYANKGQLDTAQYDLSLILEESESGIKGKLEYASGLYHAETISRMAGHYQTLLSSIVKQ